MIQAHKVHTNYEDIQILQDVSIRVKKGEIVALIGRNGAGKTTLFKNILGLKSLNQGKIFFNETEITHSPAHKISTLGIGYLPQGARIFPGLTVQENIEMVLPKHVGYDKSFENVSEIFLNNISLADSRLMRSLHYLLGDRKDQLAGTLSGGQRQMVCLARALL